MSNNNSAQLREERLRSMPVSKLLTTLSLPAMFAMFINALYNFVDTIFVGQGIGPLGIAALSISFPLQMIIGAVGLMFGVGGASMASRFLGAGDEEGADKTLGTATIFVIVLGTIAFVLLQVFLDEILVFVGATESTLPYAREYARTVLIGFFPLSLAMAANNFIRAEGDARTSMMIMLSGAVVNLVLDPIFIFAFDWGVRGAALATIAGQFVNFFLGYGFLLSKKSKYHLKLRYLLPEFRFIGEIIGLGVPTFFRQMGTSILLIVVNNMMRLYASDADIMIAVMGIINRLMMFSLMPLFGLVQGMQPIAGFNYGARQYQRVHEVVNTTMKRGFYVTMLFFALFMIFPGPLMALFSNDSALITRGIYYMRVIFSMLPIVGFQIVGAAYFQALGKVSPSFFLSTSRQFILLLPMVVIFSYLWGVQGLAWAFPVSDIITTILTMVWYRIDSRQLFTQST